MMMPRVLLAALAVALSSACYADGELRPISISECMTKNCMSREVHVSSPEENFRVQAWFDIVTWPDKQITYFYPLFNVFNYSTEEAEVLVGMQLLDGNETVSLEATSKSRFAPTKQTEGSYETYLSINAQPVTMEIAKKTRFLKVLYRR